MGGVVPDMTDLVRRLLETHEFCRLALTRHRHRLDTESIRKLESDRERSFYDLATHVSTNPKVTLAQVQLLLSGLALLANDKEAAEQLRKVCADAVTRLASAKPARAHQHKALHRAPTRPAAHLRQVLDSLPERAAIFDASYRYTYTNPANAEFHGMSVAEMKGLPSWRIIGTRAFETVTRRNLDRCLAGQTFTIFTRRSGNRLYRTHFAPLKSADGRTMSAVVTVRDVARVDAPDSVVWDLPEPDAN